MRIIEVSEIGDREVREVLARRSLRDETAEETVRKIVDDVRHKGDQALLEYTRRFDGAGLSASELRVGDDEFKQALSRVSADFIQAIDLAKDRIFDYHRRQRRRTLLSSRKGGILLEVTRPLRRVGAYVPGGRAAYPSSVLMNTIPAKVAGVNEIALCVPPDADGLVNDPTLAAAHRVGISEVYKVGGAQAIAAMAYGTETIKRVDKITGPGNIYVTLAKKLLQGEVGIDMIAGPSEIVVLADESANKAFVAADMLGQAEHDASAMAVLVTTSKDLANQVQEELDSQVTGLKRREIAEAALAKNGLIFLCPSLEIGLDLVNLIAPEHLEIMVRGAGPVADIVDKVRNAGAIFLGQWSPEALGDYVAGPNHILPTAGTARFYSPLGVEDFLKRSHVIYYTQKGLKKVEKALTELARTEGLEAHARSVEIRLETETEDLPGTDD